MKDNLMHHCNKCDVDFNGLQCPECNFNANEAEDWVDDEELYNWQDRVSWNRDNERIMIQTECVRQSLSSVYPDCEPIEVREVPDVLEAIEKELAVIEETRFGFFRNLFDAKMAITEAIENGY